MPGTLCPRTFGQWPPLRKPWLHYATAHVFLFFISFCISSVAHLLCWSIPHCFERRFPISSGTHNGITAPATSVPVVYHRALSYHRSDPQSFTDNQMERVVWANAVPQCLAQMTCGYRTRFVSKHRRSLEGGLACFGWVPMR